MSRLKTLGAGLAVAAGSVVCLGCELGQNLQDIANAFGNPDLETVEGEGDQIVEGSYRNVRFDGNNADGVFIVAIERPSEDSEERVLTLISYPDAEDVCSAGPAQRYGTSLSEPGEEETKRNARIPFIMPSTDESPRTLRFSNFACEVDDVGIVGSSLPLDSEFAEEPGFIAQTDEGELHFINPWRGEQRLLASNLASIRRSDLALFAQGVDDTWMWTLEGGEIVVRDRDFKVVERLGQDVVAMTHSASGEGGPMIAFQQADGSVRAALVSDLDEPPLIEEDGCAVSFGSGMNGRRLQYYSPCEERKLIVYDLDTEDRFEVATGVANYRVVGERSDGPVVSYLINEDGNGSVGALWARFGTEPAIKLGEDAHLGLTRLAADGELELVDSWVSGEGGDLSIGRVGKELTRIGRGVVYYSSLGIIGDYDGELGTLYTLEDDALTRIQRGVSTRGIRYDSPTKRGLVLVDYDGAEGTLTLIKQSEAIELSENVRPDSYQFTVQLPTVTILSDLDEETGTATLKLRRIDSDEETIVSDGVSETLEVSWPKEGMLYSVPEGARSGIWFTAAR